MNNQAGSALVITVIILVLLSIIGSSATRTTNVELHIASNERTYKQNFYQADGAAKLAVQKKLNGDYGSWIAASDNSTTIPDKYYKETAKRPQVLNNIDVEKVMQDWNSGALEVNATAISSMNPRVEYIAIANPWTGNFVVLGRSREKGGDVWIEIGCERTE